MSGYAMMRALDDGCAALAICDPQFRAVLDAMAYGNEATGKAKRRAALPQMTDATITAFVEEIERLLHRSGHLALWIDKFTLASGRHLSWIARTELALVDLIAWNKGRMGMGARTRCQTEYLVILQKPPKRARGIWTDKRLTDHWTEHAERTVHPHAKPLQLTERIVRAVTKAGDLVVDPCAGSYGVLDVCQRTRRDFVGCDLST